MESNLRLEFPKNNNGIDVKAFVETPDIQVYVFSDLFLPESKEQVVDTDLIESHIKRAANDKNGVAFITGRLSRQLQKSGRGFTIEDMLIKKNDVAQIMNNADELRLEYHKYIQIEDEKKRDDYFLKASEQFKRYAIIYENDGEKSLVAPARDKDGKVDITSKDFNTAFRELQPILEKKIPEENTKRYVKLFRPLVENNKLIGIYNSNEEFKSKNVGAFDYGEKISEGLNAEELYISKNRVKAQIVFNGYTTKRTEQVINLDIIAKPTNSLDAAEKFVNMASAEDNDFDVLLLTGCPHFGISHKQRWYYDEEHELFLSKPQILVFMPGYSQMREPNPVRNASYSISSVNEYKLNFAVVLNEKIIKHPELLDRYGKINSISSLREVTLTKDQIKELRKKDKVLDYNFNVTNENQKKLQSFDEVNYLESVDGVYDSPFEPIVDAIPIDGKSKLVSNAHRKNAPQSLVYLEKIARTQRYLDEEIYSAIRELSTKTEGEAIIAEIKKFDYTDPMEVHKVMSSVVDQELVKELVKGGK